MTNPTYEKVKINLTTAVAGLVFLATIALGLYARANDEAIDRAEASIEKQAGNVEKNGDQIADLTRLLDKTVTLVSLQGDSIKSAASDAKQNRESLIRIETKLKTRGSE